jgi:crotonobetainyl-CoA:carnitine CoA-transferase CaiB-like acyl-CoA transferase
MKGELTDYLTGLKVVELASVLAGPTVGMFFSELGAKVTKIESPIGDVTRSWKLESEDSENRESAYFYSANYKKDYLTLDLRQAHDYEKCVAVVKDADIIISNFKPSSASKLRVDYDQIKQYNNEIIYAQLLSFDKDIDRPAYDVIIQAESGFLSMTGLDKQQLCKMPVALIDLIAAHQMKEAILLSLIKKVLTGKGSYIEVSLLDTGITALANQASNYLNAGSIAKPMGLLHPNIAPYGETFTLEDGTQIVLAITNDTFFDQLLKTLGLQKKEQYSSNTKRLENRDSLFKYIEDGINSFATSKLLSLFDEKKIPYGVIKNIKEVMKVAKDRNLILSEDINGRNSHRIRTIGFNIE